MQATWTKNGADWCVRLVAPAEEIAPGSVVTVSRRDGSTKDVTLSELVKRTTDPRGQVIHIYKIVADPDDKPMYRVRKSRRRRRNYAPPQVKPRTPDTDEDEEADASRYLALSTLAISNPERAWNELHIREHELARINEQPTSMDYFVESMRERERAAVLELEISVLRHALAPHDD